uniref:NADH-ubiquinone oxidoreductase chain 1 n=1 Tax=Usnea ceratina TaxID=142670 RepID=A0A286QI05_9LECA|nr:NADH dehydrogenase subunit 1 [Usnea ceratina]
MIYLPTLVSILEVLIVTVPVLLTVAYVTVAERKTMASMQRRLGPNIVGYYGLLQAFADALKLLLKEYVAPTQANMVLFFIGPIITLIFSLLGYSVIPYGPGLGLSDFDLGILYLLAVSSLSTYGIINKFGSANSKYAFLGSLRSTAQLISYEESELVSGFMTEHAAVIFVFFFLAEYASIVLICILTSVLFLGGYLLNLTYIAYLINAVDPYSFFSYPLVEGTIYALTLGFKACVMIFIFFAVRASYPRVRYDQLMSFCWTILLPIVISFIVALPCVIYSFEIFSTNISLL